jgi:hypothetical protein
VPEQSNVSGGEGLKSIPKPSGKGQLQVGGVANKLSVRLVVSQSIDSPISGLGGV